eukprot:GEMP01051581.1.p1 GENE.GEMP01051581.1~~GEMP01051581.1.p1  ORF type:complete len:265 (+),score=23.01 GEMP01051581.1:107-901(+)
MEVPEPRQFEGWPATPSPSPPQIMMHPTYTMNIISLDLVRRAAAPFVDQMLQGIHKVVVAEVEMHLHVSYKCKKGDPLEHIPECVELYEQKHVDQINARIETQSDISALSSIPFLTLLTSGVENDSSKRPWTNEYLSRPGARWRDQRTTENSSHLVGLVPNAYTPSSSTHEAAERFSDIVPFSLSGDNAQNAFRPENSMVCRHWKSKGYCKLNDVCKFQHLPESRGSKNTRTKDKKRKSNVAHSKNWDTSSENRRKGYATLVSS